MAKKPNKKLSELLIDNVKKFAIGITSEKLSALFFNSKKLKKQPEPVYRLDNNGYRYYYRFENGEPVFYTSVTTMLREQMPTPLSLKKWVSDMGWEESIIEMNERAKYGTFLHAECGELLTLGKYNLDKMDDKLDNYIKKEKLPLGKILWSEDLKRDILSFAQFMKDVNLEPLAIELILWHPLDGYAGAIDLVCEMDIEEKGFFGDNYLSGVNKGQPKETRRTKRIKAIIDLKSGRKGFYASGELQLHAYKEMWNIHFPDMKIEKVFNWSPKEWRNSPTYNLKDQTGSIHASKLPDYVSLAKKDEDNKDVRVTLISGIIDVLKGMDKNLEEVTLKELVKKRHETIN